jgi:hypothetical protein
MFARKHEGEDDDEDDDDDDDDDEPRREEPTRASIASPPTRSDCSPKLFASTRGLFAPRLANDDSQDG